METMLNMTVSPDLDTQIRLWTLFFQSAICFIFIGSLLIALYNLKAFRQSTVTATLKTVLDDYRKLVANYAFDNYNKDLLEWQEKLADSDFNPTTFYQQYMQHISAIGTFYEWVGVLVRKNLIEFDILFEVLPFPDKFWDDTTEFYQIMRQICYSDFWENFEFLRRRYLKKRQAKKQTVANQLAAFKNQFRLKSKQKV